MLKTFLVIYFSLFAVIQASYATDMDKSKAEQSAKTLEVAQAFLWAAGSGDMEQLSTLMADDFVWHNEGDGSIPWIGNWESKETVLNTFLPRFGAGLKTTSWTTDYSFANGDQAVFMGTMSAIANNTGADTGKFSWAVRVQVVDGKVKSWNWFEDSFAVSKAYHTEK
ncbi:nuclear transport factor 2 family protein [Vibrio sp. 10N.286.52.C3]|uniref:nuclear transport factor 2 family protein n=1 Tax=Vibrio TaxID=662 RepID=UPI00102A49E1|nr:nuclear transport factor 2 family protein [Vibrio vulnificus]EGR0753505.1 nuclear transport factor 2 family protein [Vibrio vulnificus]RZP84755.1 nuclear transport factor 2 family protein [Vibrio vulnificus]